MSCGAYPPHERRAVNPEDEVSVTKVLYINDHFAIDKEQDRLSKLKSLNLDPHFVSKITNALGNSNNPSNKKRQQAYANLTEAYHMAGYASALLQISRNKNIAA